MNLADQYAFMHRQGHFKGGSILEYAEEIGGYLKRYSCKTVLDYGCGQGEQYSLEHIHRDWNARVTPYDFAVPAFSKKPTGTFDAVLCTDVLEHVEGEDISEMLDEIFGYAEKFVFLSICTREARKLLPDGRNVHLSVFPREWWEFKIGPRPVPVEVRWTK